MRKNLLYTICALVLISGALSSCRKDANDPWADVDYFPARVSGERWSLVNRKGEVKFENEFKKCPTLVCDGVFIIGDGRNYSVNKLGGSDYEPIGQLKNLKSVGYFEDDLIPAAKFRERISVFSKKGEKQFELLPVGGQEVIATSNHYSDGRLLFTLEDGRKGYFDKSGAVAIDATYTDAFDFSEGLAMVQTSAKGAKLLQFKAIDTEGNVAFSFAPGHRPTGLLTNGYVIARAGKSTVLYTKKGELINLPSEIKYIRQNNGKNIIFVNDKGLLGVANMKGEVVVGPNFEWADFDGDNIVAVGADDVTTVYNEAGEELRRLDYKVTKVMGPFGYLVWKDKTYFLIDREGERKGETGLEKIGVFGRYACQRVTTDFIDYDAVAEALLKLIKPDGVGFYKFGISSSQVFANAQPCNYTDVASGRLPLIIANYFNFGIRGVGEFTETIATGNSETGCRWNDNARLRAVELKLDSDVNFGYAGYGHLVAALKTAGFNPEGKNFDGKTLTTTFANAQTLVTLAYTPADDSLVATVAPR